MATYFQSVNRNKTSVVLDLRAAADLERARELVAGADVVVENFRPGVMDGLGLGYEHLRAGDPALIYCSITGFGAGAGAALPGYDLLVQAVGGLMSITGTARRRAAEGRRGARRRDLRAVREHRHPRGAAPPRAHAARASVSRSTCSPRCSPRSSTRPPRTRSRARSDSAMGNAHPSVAPYDLFHAADGELVIAVGTDAQFTALCTVLGCPALAEDARFASNALRAAAREALTAELETRLMERPASAWVSALSEVGVPAGQVNDIAGAFALAERLGLEPTVAVPRADGGTARLPRNPIGLSATPASYRLAPPSLPSA